MDSLYGVFFDCIQKRLIGAQLGQRKAFFPLHPVLHIQDILLFPYRNFRLRETHLADFAVRHKDNSVAKLLRLPLMRSDKHGAAFCWKSRIKSLMILRY